jgi:hypothetical protein
MNPLSIYQAALDAVSSAILADDFGRYAAMIDLPYLVQTQNARFLVTTPEDLRPTFDALHEMLQVRGVTHYERVARDADYVGRDRIDGRHFTHLISNGERLSVPYMSRQAIVRRGECWFFSEAHYRLKADRWPITHANLEQQFGLTAGDRGAS